ncbi:uncharacterized protein LOC117176169 [Belonocnema kinseyi]|uniref:uncharacterized protein LOC117176169 n=1 Tax=Belonocnema kinseyi TaxID=2817044 RepID=UPI00143CC584|nr:uncharacterized protein LOC117176169 [Belonocnema kinseyi]
MTQNFKVEKAIFLCYLWLILQIGPIIGNENMVVNNDAERLSNATQNIANASLISGFQDPDVKEAIKSALGNNSASEVIVKKNLLLFPLNAPNLVLSHKQEFHTIPQVHDKNSTDDATYTELAEVNEFSLSELIPLNASTTKVNGSEQIQGKGEQISGAPKVLEVISGFNLPDGLMTEKIPLPESIKNSIPAPTYSILGLLSTTTIISNSREEKSIAKTELEDLIPPSNVDDSSLNKKMAPRSADSFLDEKSIQPAEKTSLNSDNLKVSDSGQGKNFEDMEVAEDIVFRPLFRYREEARFKPKNNDQVYRRSSYRRRPDSYGYSTSYVPPRRYRPRDYNDY